MSDKIDYDKYGHCVYCHKNLMVKQVVDGQIIDRLLPDYSTTEFLLNDGSLMKVAICKSCKKSNYKNEEIMASVIKGWDIETDILVADDTKPKWTKEIKNKYMDKMSKLEIVSNSENKSMDVLDKELQRFNKVKGDKNGSNNKTKHV